LIPPKDGYILRTAGKATDFALAHMKVGDPITAEYKVLPQDSSKNYDVEHFKMMIGGGTILVDNGQPAEFSRNDTDVNGYRARTAVGYSKDQRYVYIITADHSDTSYGMSLQELQQFMVQLGVWKGLNLDGGGSTQMVARPLGETNVQLVNNTEYGSERQVVNGLGVYSLAPKGEVKNFTLSGETHLLLNEQAQFQMKGYDIYYNPIDLTGAVPEWSQAPAKGWFLGDKFIPTRTGSTVLTATYGQGKADLKVQVIGRDDVASLKIQPSSGAITENADIPMMVTLTTKDGTARDVPPESLKWELIGIDGKMEGNTLHVDSVKDTENARLIADYDGFRTMVALQTGEWKSWADFDQTSQPVSFTNYPAEVTGSVSVVAGLPGKSANDRAVQLKYDFTQGTGTKAGYVLFGSSGIPIAGQPQSLRVNVLGDNSLNWLRAEFVDGKGETKVIDLAKAINWSGWKTLTADLGGLNFPVTLKRIYAVDIAQGQDERAAVGSIALDDLSFLYKSGLPSSTKSSVQLTIDKPEISVNGKVSVIDQAPVIVDGNTLVPVRFIVEALGGEVLWDNDERKAIVMKDNHLIDAWLGKKDLVMDGERVTAEVAPQLINERTMIPLRLLAEKMGWKVTWNNDTRSVTLN